MMFNIELAKNFEEDYKKFIADTAPTLPEGYFLCFEGFVGKVFVKIGRTSFGANKKKEPDFAVFLFKNTQTPIKRQLYLPIKLSLSTKYDKYYYQFKIKDFERILPQEFTDLLTKERCIHRSKTTTSFSRIIAGCQYKLFRDNELLRVHHRDFNSLNDNIDNLIPIPDVAHKNIFHKIGKQCTEAENYFSKASKYSKEKGLKVANFIMKSPYKYELAQIIKTRDFSIIEEKPDSPLALELWAFHHIIAFIEGEKRNYSRYFNNEVLYIIHYLRYIKGIKSFNKLKRYNGIKLPCARTVKNYLKSSIYREFSSYYPYMIESIEKLSKI